MFRWKRPIDRELFCCILSSYLGFVSFFLDRQKKKPFAHFSISKTGEVHRADKEIISDRKQEKEKNLERQKKKPRERLHLVLMSTAGNSFKQQSLNKPHFWTQKPQHTNSHASRPVERWQDITHSFAMLVAFCMYMLCVWVCASVSAPVCTTAFVSRPCMRASVVFFSSTIWAGDSVSVWIYC